MCLRSFWFSCTPLREGSKEQSLFVPAFRWVWLLGAVTTNSNRFADCLLGNLIGRYSNVGNVCFGSRLNGWMRLRSQTVDATHALNLSAGVLMSNVFRGRSLSSRATLFRCASAWRDRSVPFGKYCRSKRLVFSLDPRLRQRRKPGCSSFGSKPRLVLTKWLIMARWSNP